MPSSKSFRRKSWRRFLAAAVEEGGAGFHPAGRFLIGLCEIRRPIKKPIENRPQDEILPHLIASLGRHQGLVFLAAAVALPAHGAGSLGCGSR